MISAESLKRIGYRLILYINVQIIQKEKVEKVTIIIIIHTMLL